MSVIKIAHRIVPIEAAFQKVFAGMDKTQLDGHLAAKNKEGFVLF